MVTDRKAFTGNIINIGGTFYLKLDPQLKDQLQPGDVLEYEPVAVAPGGQLSKTRMIAQPPVRIQRAATAAKASKVVRQDASVAAQEADRKKKNERSGTRTRDHENAVAAFQSGLIGIPVYTGSEGLLWEVD